jgi:hypothetical protein
MPLSDPFRTNRAEREAPQRFTLAISGSLLYLQNQKCRVAKPREDFPLARSALCASLEPTELAEARFACLRAGGRQRCPPLRGIFPPAREGASLKTPTRGFERYFSLPLRPLRALATAGSGREASLKDFLSPVRRFAPHLSPQSPQRQDLPTSELEAGKDAQPFGVSFRFLPPRAVSEWRRRDRNPASRNLSMRSRHSH